MSCLTWLCIPCKNPLEKSCSFYELSRTWWEGTGKCCWHWHQCYASVSLPVSQLHSVTSTLMVVGGHDGARTAEEAQVQVQVKLRDTVFLPVTYSSRSASLLLCNFFWSQAKRNEGSNLGMKAHDLRSWVSNRYKKTSQALVAYTCNPVYLGGWDWEDQDLRPGWANRSQDPISKMTRAKWTGGVAQVAEHKALSLKPFLGVGDLVQGKSACLASARPWVWSPALKK
jgi:hypothetical protein